MTAKVYSPQVSVILKKNIGRANVAGSTAASQRFQGTARTIDLTPFLGENGGVFVEKSVRLPAAAFSIVIADKMVNLDSLYGLIESMDCIDIRMAHDVSPYAGKFAQNMPIMLRGFVTAVRRKEGMSRDGRPVRYVRVDGHGYGKVLQIMRVTYLPQMVLGQNLLTNFKLFANYGVGSEPNQDASAFVTSVVNNIVNPFIDNMRTKATANGVAQGISPLIDMKVDALVQNGIISPFGVNQWPGGSIHELLTFYGDCGAWNELYVDDREDASYLVYRPTPFQDAQGNFIQEPYSSDASSAPAINVITDADVIDIEYGRSDAGVANYFWVDSPRYLLNNGQVLQTLYASGADNSLLVTDYPNNSPDLYGIRKMEVQTQQGARFDGQPEKTFDAESNSALAFVNARRATLINNNKDNVVFEDGAIILRGNEAIGEGTFVRLLRRDVSVGSSGFQAQYYAHTVSHAFRPFSSYTTTIRFDRGTGFIERVQRGAGVGAPYLAEINPWGVYA